MDEKALFCMTSGIYILTAHQGDKDNGCIINTANQVTMEPCQICVTVNKYTLTHDMIRDTGELAVSILSEKAEFPLIQRFGFQSGRDVNKFSDFDSYVRGKNGVNYIVKGCNSFIAGKVKQVIELPTHSLFIAQVTDMEVLNDVPSASYEFYHEHIKPKEK